MRALAKGETHRKRDAPSLSSPTAVPFKTARIRWLNARISFAGHPNVE